MISGMFAGIMWALETVILGMALNMDFITSSKEGASLAPFICTFLHDTCSAIFLWIYVLVRGERKEVVKVFKSPDFKWLVAASAIGGPIGMTGYVLAVNHLGASIGALTSAIYPAIGSVLAYIFLKQHLKRHQWFFLALTLLGVLGISYSPGVHIGNFQLGILGAFMCAFGWGTEGVVLSKCMKNDDVKSRYALLFRQSTSGVIYGLLIIPVIGGMKFTSRFFLAEHVRVLVIIGLAALCATISYLFYYKTIARKGVAKAMALNITYTVWSVFFSVLIYKDFSLLNPVTLGCGVLIVVSSILAATDGKGHNSV